MRPARPIAPPSLAGQTDRRNCSRPFLRREIASSLRAAASPLLQPFAIEIAVGAVAVALDELALRFAAAEGGAILRGPALGRGAFFRLADPIEIDHRRHDPFLRSGNPGSRTTIYDDSRPRDTGASNTAPGAAAPSSPRRQLARTKRRIALDRLPPRSASIADNNAFSDIRRRAAISPSASQKADSSDTLVA